MIRIIITDYSRCPTVMEFDTFEEAKEKLVELVKDYIRVGDIIKIEEV